MGNYFSKPAVVQVYRVNESDFYIRNIGYNDFNVIKPIKSVWVQNLFTLHYVLEGSGTLLIGGKTYRVVTGDLFILPAGEKRCYYPDEGNPWKYFWFDFGGTAAKEFCNCILERFGGKNAFQAPFDQTLFGAFLGEFGAVERVNYFKTLSLFYSVLGALNISASETIDADIMGSIENSLTLNAYSCEFTVAALCRILHLSHSNLCHLYKKNTGRTVKSRLTELRMKKAMELITTTDKKIKTIAYEVGYTDELNFMKMFKRYFGKPATHFKPQ